MSQEDPKMIFEEPIWFILTLRVEEVFSPLAQLLSVDVYHGINLKIIFQEFF